jgi:prevent-host-death family protein
MYSAFMANREIQFSRARQQLTAILNEIQTSGQPVTIIRRGKPSAVIISPEYFQARFGKAQGQRWTLKGSLKEAPGVDLGQAIDEQHLENIQKWKRRLKKWDEAAKQK